MQSDKDGKEGEDLCIARTAGLALECEFWDTKKSPVYQDVLGGGIVFHFQDGPL